MAGWWFELGLSPRRKHPSWRTGHHLQRIFLGSQETQEEDSRTFAEWKGCCGSCEYWSQLWSLQIWGSESKASNYIDHSLGHLENDEVRVIHNTQWADHFPAFFLGPREKITTDLGIKDGKVRSYSLVSSTILSFPGHLRENTARY